MIDKNAYNVWQHNIHATQKFTYDQNNQVTTFIVTRAKHYLKKQNKKLEWHSIERIPPPRTLISQIYSTNVQ